MALISKLINERDNTMTTKKMTAQQNAANFMKKGAAVAETMQTQHECMMWALNAIHRDDDNDLVPVNLLLVGLQTGACIPELTKRGIAYLFSCLDNVSFRKNDDGYKVFKLSDPDADVLIKEAAPVAAMWYLKPSNGADNTGSSVDLTRRCKSLLSTAEKLANDPSKSADNAKVTKQKMAIIAKAMAEIEKLDAQPKAKAKPKAKTAPVLEAVA